MNGMPSDKNEIERNNTAVVTSSLDHSIRLWWKVLLECIFTENIESVFFFLGFREKLNCL